MSKQPLRTGSAPAEPFAPFEDLAAPLLVEISAAPDDTAHDLSHILRVWQSVRQLVAAEGGDLETLVAATILHDCVHVPKDDPRRAQASRLAAKLPNPKVRSATNPTAELRRRARSIADGAETIRADGRAACFET